MPLMLLVAVVTRAGNSVFCYFLYLDLQAMIVKLPTAISFTIRQIKYYILQVDCSLNPPPPPPEHKNILEIDDPNLENEKKNFKKKIEVSIFVLLMSIPAKIHILLLYFVWQFPDFLFTLIRSNCEPRVDAPNRKDWRTNHGHEKTRTKIQN